MPILVLKDNEQFGPFELDELIRHVEAGSFLLTDHCWEEGWEEWRPIHSIVKVPAPKPVPLPPATTSNRPIPSDSAAGRRSSRRKLVVLGGAVGLVLILAYFASPYATLYRLKGAVERNDAVFVADRVDFPQLRESFKGAIMARLAQETAEGEGDGFEALGAALGALMVGPMVDAFVTPEGLVQMMQGRDLDEMMNEEAGASEPPPTTTPDEGPREGGSDGGMDVSRMGYENLNRFAVTLAGGPAGSSEGETATLLFSRQGLIGWKLSGVRIERGR